MGTKPATPPAETPSQKETFEEFVARRVRELRSEKQWTQEQLVEVLRRTWDLPWSRATLANIERGNRAVSAKELIALFDIFDGSKGFFAGTGGVAVTDQASLTLRAIQVAFTPEPFDSSGHDTPLYRASRKGRAPLGLIADTLRLLDVDPTAEKVAAVMEGMKGDDEARAARSLAVPVKWLAYGAVMLWGRRLPQERDAAMQDPSDRSSSAKVLRGHITRSLLADLREHIEAHRDDLERLELT